MFTVTVRITSMYLLLEFYCCTLLHIQRILSRKISPDLYFVSLFLDGLSSLACSHSELILELQVLQTVGRTPWTGDQPISMPLLIQDNTSREKTQTYIHASSGIRTHDPSVRAAEDISCLRRAATAIGPAIFLITLLSCIWPLVHSICELTSTFRHLNDQVITSSSEEELAAPYDILQTHSQHRHFRILKRTKLTESAFNIYSVKKSYLVLKTGRLSLRSAFCGFMLVKGTVRLPIFVHCFLLCPLREHHS
jgi:hypothetical protein